MRKLYPAFAIGSAFLFATGAFSQDKARAIVEKAIQAQGGEANVAELRTMRIKAEGTMALPGQPDLPFTIEDTWQMPKRYKTTSTFRLMGRQVIQTQAIDGDRGWIRIDGQTQDLPREAITEMSEQKYAEDLGRLAFLKARGIQLSALDEIKVDGRPAVGIIVKSAGHRDVKLYFDVASGLLVKREHRVLDPSSRGEVLQEVIFGDYQAQGGLKHYKRITAYRDGKKVLEAKVTEIEFFKNLGEKVFARP
jgi:hypothetical protein